MPSRWYEEQGSGGQGYGWPPDWVAVVQPGDRCRQEGPLPAPERAGLSNAKRWLRPAVCSAFVVPDPTYVTQPAVSVSVLSACQPLRELLPHQVSSWPASVV